MATAEAKTKTELSFEDFKIEVIEDYRRARISRELSLLGRREVLTGKAKFGIFGDGKELPQIALAKQFQNGDFRSGYYRDQTLMMAIGQMTPTNFLAGLYADTNQKNEPFSAGRQMGGHFSTQTLNSDGSWKKLTEQKNSSADISPTAGQMPRLLGLALASKKFRENDNLSEFTDFSIKGNEVAFGTIGDASTSEGLFFETMNAAGVLQVPMVMNVWDDGHGISVPKRYQTTKENISELLAGFEETEEKAGFKIMKVKGWDYPGLCRTYQEAVAYARKNHTPVLVHVEEVTQPQGHSTSGSHERYKSKERLDWEIEYDNISQFRKWILDYKKEYKQEIASEEDLDAIDKEAKKIARDAKKEAWSNFLTPYTEEQKTVLGLISEIAKNSKNKSFIEKLANDLSAIAEPGRKEIISAAKKTIRLTIGEDCNHKEELKAWLTKSAKENKDRYNSYLLPSNEKSALNIEPVAPTYDGENPQDGRLILRDNFDKQFEQNPLIFTFGEDVGKIGGVNQSMEGMQDKFGESRVTDTGIREATIIGQGIGMAMRGLRPIAEIQYLDYLLYGIQILSDDLATLHYRTKGTQKAPLIVRTRGHRLEGVWHSGSPMGMIINSLRGMHVCVPRNMTVAAGFYNTLLESDDPALVIECLNGYRSKENMPTNLGEFRSPLGIPEVTREGTDITLVSYGSTFNICTEVAKQLAEVDISVELVDVQTLLPFDINHKIVESIKKTNRVIFVDEDVPGGATAYMLDKVMVEQEAYQYLDSKPVTLASKAHRPAYGSDGDYFSKPNAESIFEAVYDIMNEANPNKYSEM
ncbi:MAG: thiamine pyrophosphate-dependent enzyme [Flavobacteriales bacterium]|nr:thiamine pyrophosphate-dependent enzyme [Flavobacteriales bacterium]